MNSYGSVGRARCVEHHAGGSGASLLQGDLLIGGTPFKLVELHKRGLGIQLRLKNLLGFGGKSV